MLAAAEGLMLKPLDSSYNDTTSGMRWIKLKKDFIPGAGDTLDFNIIGASWQKRRGRALLGELQRVAWPRELMLT